MATQNDGNRIVMAGKEPSLTSSSASDVASIAVTILAPFASMWLTAVLFLMAIFIVFVGTLAQVEKDIWQVIEDYFRMDLSSIAAAARSAFAWVDFRVFFPRSFFPQMEPIPSGIGFWFPSGWLIGIALFVNLAAAQLIQCIAAVRGRRLLPVIVGLLVLLVGTLVTVAVILAGSFQNANQLRIFSDWPSLRILWLLLQCTVASVVLLIGCVLVLGKKAGLMLLHAGIGLLMLGELLVGVGAVEGRMHISEGETVNYVMNSRELELAVVDTSGQTEDQVVAIPQSFLEPGKVISDKHLAFDIKVVSYLGNAGLRRAAGQDGNPATAGVGINEIAERAPPISGVSDTDDQNRPAAYLELLAKDDGRSLGVYLISFEHWLMGRVESVRLGDALYELSLRFQHVVKPYSLHLIDVRQDVYMGTRTPKSYSSHLQLVDPTRNVDRHVKIWMNNPLRFAGETFYQSTYGSDRTTAVEYTGLQVVSNTGWRIPYVACMMVTVGMLAQFLIVLARFLQRRSAAGQGSATSGAKEKAGTAPPPPVVGKRRPSGEPREVARWSRARAWVLPAILVTACGLWFLSKTFPSRPAENEYDFVAFGRLPVMHEGRVKPFDTLARNSLRIISDRETLRDKSGKGQPATQWLLDVITDADAAGAHQVFRIHNPEVREILGLETRKGFRYALDEFRDKLEAFDKQAQRARAPGADEYDLVAKKVLELEQKLHLYVLLRESFRVPPLRADHVKEDLTAELRRRDQYATNTLPLAIPPIERDDAWQAYTHASFDAMAQGMVGREANAATVAFARILTSYQQGELRPFNRHTRDYRQVLEDHRPEEWDPAKTDFEARFNQADPVRHTMILYLLAFVVAGVSWLGWTKLFNRTAFWLVAVACVAHTLALLARMYISGRPPITNLYSSAVFVGWGCVVAGLIFERVYRIGIGSAMAAISGFGTLLIAFLLTTAVPSFKGDSFTVLVAVLDTQFWLATHVVCITLGYSTTFLAGLFGIAYVCRGLLTPSLTADVRQALGRMIYGTLCFAILFSFVGTVLGGLWADDSWGRFWGWDPKENGALIIVLWNALVLHMLRARMIGDRGSAVLAILGNVITAWSWFGVNELRVGLHTYGFTEGVLLILAVFWASQLFLFVLGLVPTRWWWSFRP